MIRKEKNSHEKAFNKLVSFLKEKFWIIAGILIVVYYVCLGTYNTIQQNSLREKGVKTKAIVAEKKWTAKRDEGYYYVYKVDSTKFVGHTYHVEHLIPGDTICVYYLSSMPEYSRDSVYLFRE